jgi:1,4-alpha-glucan branching enzyme
VRAFLAYMWTHPGKQLLFMGSSSAGVGVGRRPAASDWWLLDQPIHYRIHAQVKDMNAATSTGATWVRIGAVGGRSTTTRAARSAGSTPTTTIYLAPAVEVVESEVAADAGATDDSEAAPTA